MVKESRIMGRPKRGPKRRRLDTSSAMLLAVLLATSASPSCSASSSSSSSSTQSSIQLSSDHAKISQNITSQGTGIRPPEDDKGNGPDELVQTETITEPSTTKKKKKEKAMGSSSSKIGNSVAGGREAASLRRIKREWRDAVKLGIAYDWIKMETISSSKDKDEQQLYVRVGPWGKNLLRWHFSVQGPPGSHYEGGIYHGRVLLPRDYPGSPPRVQVLTPSGRFIPGADICLSASAFHPESWTPRWNILSLIEALGLHMLTSANEIGGMDATPDERRKYARQSRTWSLGRGVDHRRMVEAGIFPWAGDGTSDKTDEASMIDSTISRGDEGDGGFLMTPVKQTAEIQLQKQLPRQVTVTSVVIQAFVEVLTSPPRLLMLALLTIFVFLNRPG